MNRIDPNPLTRPRSRPGDLSPEGLPLAQMLRCDSTGIAVRFADIAVRFPLSWMDLP
jgi:hypothetical protein